MSVMAIYHTKKRTVKLLSGIVVRSFTDSDLISRSLKNNFDCHQFHLPDIELSLDYR